MDRQREKELEGGTGTDEQMEAMIFELPDRYSDITHLKNKYNRKFLLRYNSG